MLGPESCTESGEGRGTGRPAGFVGIVGPAEPAQTEEDGLVGGSLSSPLCLRGRATILFQTGSLVDWAWRGGGRNWKIDRVRDDPVSLSKYFLNRNVTVS